MKRKVVSFITALALCLNLCPAWAMAAGWKPDPGEFGYVSGEAGSDASPLAADDVDEIYNMKADESVTRAYNVTSRLRFDTHEYTYTATKTTAFIVKDQGKLYLFGKAVTSQNGAGVQVQTGGSLSITDPDLVVTGSTYALDVASSADKNVQLSGGTFTGQKAAIQVVDGNFTDLLKEGYGYFDASGKPIETADMAAAKTVVVKHTQDELTISWDAPSHEVPYDGAAVDNLPTLTITQATGDLSELVQYSYRKVSDGDVEFTNGLPVNAGKYEVKASIPEQQAYKAAETNPCLELTINKINPFITEPKAATLIYNGTAQELVTGEVHDGAVIRFARSKDGTYSTDIPTETNAGDYEVWYQVAETENYNGFGPAKIENVQIQRNSIKPTVELSEYKYLYDGAWKEPKVTVKYGEIILPSTEYTVTYENNREVSAPGNPAKVIVTDKPQGNYELERVEVKFEITKQTQDALSITNKPDTVTYGDQFTLNTSGGSDNGTVTWKITAGEDVAEVGENSGQVKIIGVGSATVKATKSGDDNFKEATAEWTFTVQSKPVTADVTVASKDYDGNPNVDPMKITATIKASDLVNNDNITISGLTGTYDNANVGTNKTVTLNSSAVTVTGNTDKKYIISYPATVKADITPKSVTVTVTLPDNNSYDYNYNGSAKTPTVTVTVDDNVNTELSANDYTVSYSNNINVGEATVTVTSKAGSNYTFKGTATFTIKGVPAVLTQTPQAKDLTYNGQPQDLVSIGTASGGTVVYSLTNTDSDYSATIPQGTNAGTYTVYYKVEGDQNHNDLTPTPNSLTVTIAKKTVNNPQITLSSEVFQYNGSQQKPTVTVRDDNNYLIPENEYEVTITATPGGDTQMVKVGTYTVKITAATNSNYAFPGTLTKDYRIEAADQASLSITGKPTIVYYGDTIQLSTSGGSGNGTVSWKITEGNNFIKEGQSQGQFKITGVGKITIEASRKAEDGGYKDAKDTWTFQAYPKPVTPEVKAENKTYDGTTNATLIVTWKPGDLVDNDKVELVGEFADVNVGNWKVTVTATGSDAAKYEITLPSNLTATIEKGTAQWKTKPDAVVPNLTYTGSAQDLLVSGGTITFGDGGVVLNGVVKYRLGETGTYSTDIPKGTNADTYTVWYKVEGTENYTGLEPASISVKIERATPTITENPMASEITSGQKLSASTLTGGKATGVGEATDDLPGNFTWKDDGFAPTNNTTVAVTCLCSVIFTPDDTTNYNAVVEGITVAVTVNPSGTGGDNTGTGGGGSGNTGTGGGGGSGSTSGGGTGGGAGGGGTSAGTGGGGGFIGGGGTGGGSDTSEDTVTVPVPSEVENDTAVSVVTPEVGDELVEDAVANQSKNVLIQPQINGNVSRTEVTIPESTIRQLARKTGADLTVSTPAADVTISNKALGTLSNMGGDVKVVTEQMENRVAMVRVADAGKTVTEQVKNGVALTLTAGDKNVENLSGGVTLSIPVKNAGPGTVAKLVHNGGVRETVRKSVLKNGQISVPLDGSKTVEIVENSKKFADVSDKNWAAGAIAFASAHELFNGTSETTFSPNKPMSRAMLATVLYNMEGCPASGQTSKFKDVGPNTWYTKSVAWATEKGIINGYGNGQFKPNQSITREDFAVMVWRYAGSPAANGQALNFTDAGKASHYALEALRWAVENGVLNGYGDGRLNPKGLATRAQAAQILKNFLEHS